MAGWEVADPLHPLQLPECDVQGREDHEMCQGVNVAKVESQIVDAQQHRPTCEVVRPRDRRDPVRMGGECERRPCRRIEEVVIDGHIDAVGAAEVAPLLQMVGELCAAELDESRQ